MTKQKKTSSPFVRIREKNKQLNSFKTSFDTLSSLLNCPSNEGEIVKAILDLQLIQKSFVETTTRLAALERSVDDIVSTRVEDLTFSINVENIKLGKEVERLNRIIDNKDTKINVQKEVIVGNKKGFWDFLYKIFNIQ